MKIDFEFTTEYGVFRDALYFDDNDVLDPVEIETLKEERLNNWLAIVNPPPKEIPEIVEIDGISYEKINIDGQIVLKPVEV